MASATLTDPIAERHAAFLAAIIADRADDGPRLIYADWLEETGEDPARAEYIRLGCLIARTDPPKHKFGCKCGRCRPRRLARMLLSVHIRRWLLDLPADFAQVFRRGFVARLVCTAGNWLARADDLLAATPLERVRLTTFNCPDDYNAVAALYDARIGQRKMWTPSAAGIMFERLWPTLKFEMPRPTYHGFPMVVEDAIPADTD